MIRVTRPLIGFVQNSIRRESRTPTQLEIRQGSTSGTILANVSNSLNSSVRIPTPTVKGFELENSQEKADLAAAEDVQKIKSVPELPASVTELIGPEGVKVYLVGAIHFCKQTETEVIQTIQKIQPNVVMLEFSNSVQDLQALDEETALRNASAFHIVRSAIKDTGAGRGMLHFVALITSAKATKSGTAPFGEHRVALAEANKIPGCKVHMGDRDLNITLSRISAALSLKETVKLCRDFLASNEETAEEETKRYRKKDLLEKELFEIMAEFPTICGIFITERDVYLAHSLWAAAQTARNASSALDGQGHRPIDPRNGAVVGVVGAAHVAGIVKYWGKTTEEQISELMRVPEPSLQRRLIKETIKITFFGLVCYGYFKLFVLGTVR